MKQHFAKVIIFLKIHFQLIKYKKYYVGTVKPYPANIFILKMSACYICCI